MAAASSINRFAQEVHTRRQEFRRLKAAGRLTPELASRMAHDVAAGFMAHRQSGMDRLAEAITLLCELATLADEAVSASGLKALFSEVVEPLADSFEPEDGAIYDAAFAPVIQFCRRLPEGRPLDAQLTRFGLRTQRDFLERVQRITQVKKFDLAQAGPVKKALVLSRVTLGADVEITSIVWQKLRQVFPSAEIVLLADDKAHELFGGDPRLRLHRLPYRRGGGLIERLSGWLSVVEAVETECRGLHPEEFLIVDPDSRLTQLGLLPVVPDETHYYFFESRSYQRPGVSGLGQLTAQWVNEVFGEGEPLYPCVHLRREDQALAEALVKKIRQRGARPLVSLNFGVGENPNKRVPDPFESQLALSLLRTGATIILDKGTGVEEAGRVEAITNTLRQHGQRVTEVTEARGLDALSALNLQADVITWQGGIGRFSALVAQSDLYIGYDSAGQHIAAALGIPTMVIFAGYPSLRFVERWRPAGRGAVKSVLAGTQPPASQTESDQIIRDAISFVETHSGRWGSA